MTIAACYVSPEGIVLGADSTTTYIGNGGQCHYYNHAQKLFEVGDGSTLGIVTWGLGGLSDVSHRALIATFSDALKKSNPTDGKTIADEWVSHFSKAYTSCPAMQGSIARCVALGAKSPYDQNLPPDPSRRTEPEEREFLITVENHTVGFCIGGFATESRVPFAYKITFNPLNTSPIPDPLSTPDHRFWGVPNFFRRLVSGCDDDLRRSILASGKWGGTPGEFDALVDQFTLRHPIIPIRDAIDFTHACIYSTIKAMKFSNLPQVCGGPIEVAVITADRKFRWVKHKEMDAAIRDGAHYGRHD